MIINNKIAIVTGASSGIGMATARLLTKNGTKVVLAARSKKILEKLSKELKDSFVIPTDMRVENDIKDMVKQTVKHFGRVDILVNNAGRGYDAPVEKINIKLFRELIDLNLIGPIISMQEVIPIMRNQGGGAIVNISSGTSLMAIPYLSAYSGLKRALNGISLTSREELAKDKITVSVVYPYITSTNFGRNIMGGARESYPDEENSGLPPADSADYIAGKIVGVIKTGKSEEFAHDWMIDRQYL